MFKRSFTFIEVVVVIGVISMLLPAIFGITFSIIKQQSRVYALAEVKRQGDYVLSVMENLIRNNALEIYAAYPFSSIKCNEEGGEWSSTDGADFIFKDKNGSDFNFAIANNQIASNSSSLNINNLLTSAKVVITTPDNFISCSKSTEFSSTLITVNFKVAYDTLSNDTAFSMNYKTKFKMLNY